MDKTKFIKEYFNFCTAMKQHPETVIVSAGGALLLLGLRDETQDLDLDVSDELFTILANRYDVVKKSSGYSVPVTATVSARRTKKDIKVICIEGVYIYSIDSLIKQKKRTCSFN